MSDDTLTAIADAIADFKKQFETSDGKLLRRKGGAGRGQVT